MRAHLQRLSFASLVVMGTALLAAPDLALARGCGGGGGGDGGHHANPQGQGGDHHGPRNRGPHGRNGGPNDGYRNGPRGRGPNNRPHNRPPGARFAPRGGSGIDVTVGGYGYPGGRVGPQTPACAELAKMRYDLHRLFVLRQQVNSGKRIITTDDGGHQRVISPGNYSRHAQNRAVGSDNSVGGSAYGLAHDQASAADIRDTSLTLVDYRISATQDRIGQLEYECEE